MKEGTKTKRAKPKALRIKHGKEAVTRLKQNTTYHETGRLSRYVSEGECGVSK